MARAESIQLNIRSRFARERATMLARRTGMTTTQVVEEALRAYVPTVDVARTAEPPGRLVRKGKLWVMPATGKTITLEEANAALDQDRLERG